MSEIAASPTTRSRWMDWTPKPQILTDSPESEPTKPSKPGFVGFDGATFVESSEIEAPDPVEQACAVLNLAGVRIMRLAGIITIGAWSDLYGPEVRAALRTVGMQSIPVRYLDSPDTADIPARYKVRQGGRSAWASPL